MPNATVLLEPELLRGTSLQAQPPPSRLAARESGVAPEAGLTPDVVVPHTAPLHAFDRHCVGVVHG